MEPFVTMVPYLLVECTLSDDQKVQYTLEPYTYARQTDGVPQCRAGDCGPFALKYIEYNDENLGTLGDVNRIRIG
ncbi:unnamed protein product [Brassica oleracea var. botrytis]|uniref:(rape) hypothetical protein n=1 Tax=Brassica napus TaxID=3708 RepID=A0A078G435_BRANA|nr:unnamed protein product [Brassica napus]CDY21240.1 BnaC02g28830D [Brassica napus]